MSAPPALVLDQLTPAVVRARLLILPLVAANWAGAVVSSP